MSTHFLRCHWQWELHISSLGAAWHGLQGPESPMDGSWSAPAPTGATLQNISPIRTHVAETPQKQLFQSHYSRTAAKIRKAPKTNKLHKFPPTLPAVGATYILSGQGLWGGGEPHGLQGRAPAPPEVTLQKIAPAGAHFSKTR